MNSCKWVVSSLAFAVMFELMCLHSLAQTELEPPSDSKQPQADESQFPDGTLPILFPDFTNVMSVGFSTDNQRLVSVATKEDVTIRNWTINGNKLIKEVNLDRAVEGASLLHGNQFLMSGLKLSRDLKRLVGCVQGKVRIWNTDDGKLVQTLPNPIRGGGLIQARALTNTPNFEVIAAPIANGTGQSQHCEIAIWQGEDYGRIKRLTHANALQITSMALSTDGSHLASGCQNAFTCVFDLAKNDLLYTLQNSNGDRKHPDTEVTEAGASQVLCLAFSPDGKKLAIGDMLGVKIVDATNGELIHGIEAPYRYGMSGLVFSSDGKLLARTATEKTVPIWSTETGKLIKELATEAHDASFSRDGKWFATGCSDDKQALAVWVRSTEQQKSISIQNDR